MLVNEQDIVLEAGVEVGFKTKFTDDWVMVAVDMRIDTVHALEDLSNHARKRLREWNTLKQSARVQIDNS